MKKNGKYENFGKNLKKTCASGISFTLTNINKTYSILAIQKRLVEVWAIINGFLGLDYFFYVSHICKKMCITRRKILLFVHQVSTNNSIEQFSIC